MAAVGDQDLAASTRTCRESSLKIDPPVSDMRRDRGLIYNRPSLRQDDHRHVVETVDIAHQIGGRAFRSLLRSADLLIVPVNEWKSIKDIHFRMHAFRAIESGVPLVRAAASGLSAAIDPWGRILGMTDFASGDRTMTAQVPVGGIPTLYAKTGDLFAWICVAGVVVALGFGASESGRRSVRLLSASEPVVAATPAIRPQAS